MLAQADAVVRPHLIMAETEAEQLSALALQMEQAAPLAADLLLREIDRAEVRPDADMPDHVVRMRSTVRFEDDANGAARSVLLVYPKEADIAAGKVSVLSLVGAGLIGLSVGQSIQWPDRDGHQRALRILKVEPPGRIAF